MQTPIDTRPRITNEEIRNKFVTRYFVQLISTKKIYEVDKVQYDFFVNNSYYIVVELPWSIMGNINTEIINGQLQLGLIDKNYKVVEYYNTKMPGLIRKLRNPLEYFVGT